MKSIDDALELRGRIFGAFELAELEHDPGRDVDHLLTFVVVGAGPTGVEMAGQIAELAHRTLKRDFRRINTARRPGHPARRRAAGAAAVRREARRARPRRSSSSSASRSSSARWSTDVDERGIDVKDKDGSAPRGSRPSTKIWAAGVAGQPARPAARRAVRRRRSTAPAGSGCNPDLTLPGHPEVFVVGDMIASTTCPGVAQVAIQGGEVRRQARSSAGSTASAPQTAVPLLRQGLDGDDLAGSARSREIGKLRLTGFIAWLLWLGVHLVYLTGFKNRVTTLLHWAVSFLGRGRSERAVTTQQVFARTAMQRLEQVEEENAQPSPEPARPAHSAGTGERAGRTQVGRTVPSAPPDGRRRSASLGRRDHPLRRRRLADRALALARPAPGRVRPPRAGLGPTTGTRWASATSRSSSTRSTSSWRGLSLTMPLKHEALRLATRRSALVERVGAANTLVFGPGGRDGPPTTPTSRAWSAALRESRGRGPFRARRCWGAGRTGEFRRRRAGRAHRRRHGRRPRLRPAPARCGPSRTPSVSPSTSSPGTHADAALAAPLVVVRRSRRARPTRSPAAVPATPGLLLDVLVRPVADAARRRVGRAPAARVLGGLDLLVHQAALQVELMTGSRCARGGAARGAAPTLTRRRDPVGGLLGWGHVERGSRAAGPGARRRGRRRRHRLLRGLPPRRGRLATCCCSSATG